MQFDSRYLYDHQKTVFVVVSGVATGIGIAPALRGYGYEVTHVTSKLQKQLGYLHNVQDYIESFEETDDIQELVDTLTKRWDIKAVIPGSEAGVNLAEHINQLLNLQFSNDSILSHTRRNKYNMHVALKAAGVSSIAQCLTSSFKELLQWKTEHNISFPIVVKPLESAGTDHVFICYNREETEEAFNKVLSSLNIFKQSNEVVLCQEFIPGQEYMVNTVSWAGKHRIIEVLKIYKHVVSNRPLYDVQFLLHPKDEDFKLINAYIKDLYKALGIYYGAAHTEVKINTRYNHKYVTLIEIATRLGGIASPSAMQETQNHSQLSVLVQSYISQNFVESLPQDGIMPYKSLAAVFLISNVVGILKRNVDISVFKKLKTYHSMKFDPMKGEEITITQDLLSSPGYIYLVGNEEAILRDIATIRTYEVHLYSELLK